MKVSLIASAPQPAPKAATALTPANKSKTAEAEVATSTAAAFSLSSTLRSVSEAKEEEWELIPLPPPDLGEVTYTLARDVVRTHSTSKKLHTLWHSSPPSSSSFSRTDSTQAGWHSSKVRECSRIIFFGKNLIQQPTYTHSFRLVPKTGSTTMGEMLASVAGPNGVRWRNCQVNCAQSHASRICSAKVFVI